MDEVRLAKPAIKLNIYFYKKMMFEFDKNVGGSSNIFYLNARRLMIYFKKVFCIKLYFQRYIFQHRFTPNLLITLILFKIICIDASNIKK